MRGTVYVLMILLCPASFAVAVEGTMLVYQQQEPGIDAYTSRMLVTSDYLRMDDGDDRGDYLLFDRNSGLISSVSHSDDTVFEIPHRAVKQRPPLKLRKRSSQVKLESAPMIGDKKPHQQRLYVNDRICYNVVAVKGLLDDARQALIAFRKTLAGEQAKMLPRLPADQQDPCDMARNIFHPGWQLTFGLPIHEWDEQGRSQMLVDYQENMSLDDRLFTLPQGYRHYSTDSIQ